MDANAAAMQQAGIPAQMLQLFEPWFVGLTVSIVEMSKQGLDPKLGLDLHFSADAQAAKKPTSGLETGDEQIAFLDGMGEAEQVQFLDETLQGSGRRQQGSATPVPHGAPATRTRCGTAWRSMRRDYPALYKRINLARNDAWVSKLDQRLRDEHGENTLVVVGSLHLLGGDGVVEKLRERLQGRAGLLGVRIEAVTLPGSGDAKDPTLLHRARFRPRACPAIAAIAVRSASIPRGRGNGWPAGPGRC